MDDRSDWSPVRHEVVGELMAAIHARIREAIEEELEAALGAGRHERSEGRLGYRNGHAARAVVTETGPTRLRMPRARMFPGKGKGPIPSFVETVNGVVSGS